MDRTNNIFLSYAHADTAVADIIERDFRGLGVYLTRDVRDLKYRSEIKEFMHKIAESNFAVLLISDAYLQSSSCLYEVIQLMKTAGFEKKILPVSLISDFYKPDARMRYYRYWQEQLALANRRVSECPNDDTLNHKKLIAEINLHVDGFFKHLTDLMLIDFDKLKSDNYRPLLDAIGFENTHLWNEAFAIQAMNNREEQEIALEAFLRQCPDNAAGLFLQADLAYQYHQFIKAKAYFKNLVSRFAGNALAHYNYAFILATHFDDHETARVYYEKAIELKPDYYQALTNLAKLLAEKYSEYAGAKALFAKSLQAYPADAGALNDYGNLLRKHFADFDGAQRQYEMALEVNPDDDKSLYNLGVLFEQSMKDYDKAVLFYEAALRSNPLKASAHFNLGNIYAGPVPDARQARLHYEKAIEIKSDYAAAYFNYSQFLLRQLNDKAAGRINYIKATTINPKLVVPDLDRIYGLVR